MIETCLGRDRDADRNRLIAELYETVLHPENAADVLLRINDHLDCDGVHLVGWDEGQGNVLVSLLLGDKIASAEERYLAHYQALDPRRAIGLSASTSVCVACHDVLDDRYVRRSEFYQDFLIPHGPRYVIGGNIYRNADQNVHVAFNHLVGRPKFGGAKRQEMKCFMFHLSRWMDQLVRAERLRTAATEGHSAFHLLPIGVVLLDPAGRVIEANSAAVHLLGAHLRQGNLGLAGVRHGSSVDSMIAAVRRTRQSRTLRLEPWGNRPALTLTVLPMSSQPTRSFVGLGTLASPANVDNLANDYVCTLVMIEPVRSIVPTMEQLRERLSLTSAEATLARALSQGISVTAFANARGVKVSTVRTQVRALLEKSGARSLRELILNLLTFEQFAKPPRTAVVEVK